MGKPTKEEDCPKDNRCSYRRQSDSNLQASSNNSRPPTACSNDNIRYNAAGEQRWSDSGGRDSGHEGRILNDTEAAQLNEQVGKYGMRIFVIPKDGNCLFGSVADQLYRDSGRHREVRVDTVRYMETHAPQFQGFVPGQPFRDYLERMQRDGEWGGNLEIKAMSELFHADIIVHTLNKPPIKVRAAEPVKVLHLAYLGRSHYDSVRYIHPEIGEEDQYRWMDFSVTGDGIMTSAPTAPSPHAFGNFDELVAQIMSLGPWTREEATHALTMADGDVDTAFALLESFAPTNFVM
eukprot:TRINITY_DN45798_c0_g1_i1.p1 TRINITY_DN45798_c0_g1~~TRINITY_DN45798_c0_g1_i1.p1  ORF type:complete len:308 (+),score=41.92 TRINITY_DN45798_c0_g1_i1:50-925(+)